MFANRYLPLQIYDFLKWVIPKLEKFPRNQKFLLDDWIETLLLDICTFSAERPAQGLAKGDNAKYAKECWAWTLP
jgi:hypothetical protein